MIFTIILSSVPPSLLGYSLLMVVRVSSHDAQHFTDKGDAARGANERTGAEVERRIK